MWWLAFVFSLVTLFFTLWHIHTHTQKKQLGKEVFLPFHVPKGESSKKLTNTRDFFYIKKNISKAYCKPRILLKKTTSIIIFLNTSGFNVFISENSEHRNWWCSHNERITNYVGVGLWPVPLQLDLRPILGPDPVYEPLPWTMNIRPT